MEKEVRLPYCSRYFPGTQMGLGWLKAVTSNDRCAARHLNWHEHDELEITFPVKGHYRYEIGGRRTVTVDSESFIVLPRNIPHRLAESIDPPGGRLHFYLRNPSSRLSPGGSLTAQEYAQIYRSLSRISLKPIPAPPLLKTTIAALGKFIATGPMPLPDGDKMQARLLCSLALSTVATAKASAPDRSPSRIFAEAVSWMERNYAASIHMDRLVERIGYSRARFFALFRQQTKMTPSEYLRNYRLEKAKEMLVRTKLPAAHIGKACGLGDPAHFSRLFSRMTGYTPLAYRRRMGPGHSLAARWRMASA